MSQNTAPLASEPPQKTTTQAAKVPTKCSKRELAELVKGEKINLFAGQPPNATFLFPVPIKLVKYFSPKWKNEIEEEKQKVLYATAHKDAIKLIIEWMLAGGVDSKAKGSIPYPNDNPLKLLCLNKLATFLQIDSLENRTLKRIDNITRSQRLSFEQMSRLFSVASIPSETQIVLERNSSRWVAALTSDEWKRCSQASTCSEQKPALITLGKLRLAIEENREKRKSLKLSSPRPNRRGQTVKKAAILTNCNAVAEDKQISGGKTVSSGKKLENTQKWVAGHSTAKTGKPNWKVWPRNGNVRAAKPVGAV